MSRNVNRDKLWSQFRARAEELGLDHVEFPVYWLGRDQQKTLAYLVDKGLRIKVTDEVLAELDSIPASFEGQLKEGKYREYWKKTAQRLRQSKGKRVPLNIYATAVRTPKEFTNRTTANINAYKVFQVKSEIKPLLSEEQIQRLGSDLDRGINLVDLPKRLFSTEADNAEAEDAANDSQAISRSDDSDDDNDAWQHHRNVIFFGPPGTGKSFKLREIVKGYLDAQDDNILRVTFHPEYSYFDFVGSYRPVVGWLSSTASFIDADGQRRESREPRTYYRFEPGPLSQALELAAAQPDSSVVLVIEEINRGNCAAIFGDAFQLLDRASDQDRPERAGWSEYAIRPRSEWAYWLATHVKEGSGVYDPDRKTLKLPGNLYLYATMNTSDQSLFPMDTAFRRRWGMEYVGVTEISEQRALVQLHAGDERGVPWVELLAVLNREIVRYTRSDDKQMGPWFVRSRSDTGYVDNVEFKSKVIFYLWNDVFRDQTSLVFSEKLETYEDVVRRYDSGKTVFSEKIVEGLSRAESV